MIVLYVIIIVLAILIAWQIIIRIIRRYAKFPAPSFFARVLDSGFRKRLEPPSKVIAYSGIKPGMIVLEVGCGPGTFTLDAARAAGPAGKVYALDIQKDMLRRLRQKLSRPENMAVQNIEIVNRSAYDLPFEASSIDLVYMVTVFQEIPDKQRALQQINRVLKSGGILAISEFLPDPDYPWMSTTERMVKKAGFTVDGHSGNLWAYTVRFRKP